MLKISPSILAADFANLKDEVKSIDNADYIHVDVMDGHFVPNLTFGIPIVKTLQEISPIPLDIHLMISNPLRYIDKYAGKNIESITVHYEAFDTIKLLIRCIELIKNTNSKVSIAIKPNTEIDVLNGLLDKIDSVLVMSVEPGFSYQKYIESSTQKIKNLKKMINSQNANVQIAVDGGINLENIKKVALAGAENVIMGGAIFKSKNRHKIINEFRNSCK
jgi:ribulose-phosphate 3-epimerase